VIRRNLGVVLTAAAVIGLLLVAFLLALAQHKLPELGLDLIVYLFAITLGVFVIERMLAWREERRWLAAKNWLYMILLETIDDLLKELLPASVPRNRDMREGGEEGGAEGRTILYEVKGERIHFGEAVVYSPLDLMVGPNEKDLQSHILWYATELGAPRYADMARAALSDAREQVRDMLASSGQLLEAEITAMVMSFDQAIAAAIRHLDSAASLRDRKLEEGSYLADGGGEEQRSERSIGEVDKELAFVSSIIVESVVNSAMKPKGWLESEMYSREGHSPFGRLETSTNRAGMGSRK
jgi:hypothetical protein